MTITPAALAALAPHISVEIAAQLAPALEEQMPKFGVDAPLPRAHFLAQACWESLGFTRFEENLRYSAERIAAVWPRLAARAAELAGNPQALANAAYARVNGNGSEQSGAGWRYRGRGLFMLTGLNNYSAASRALGVALVGDPDLAAKPQNAVLTSCWFWKINGCGLFAAADDCEEVTRIINGPPRDGLTERRALTARAKQIFT